jgi:hypothetical protein
MPDIVRKVGLISCSGEDLPEGTISRLATRLVLEELRPLHTVTICLPLFLAGGESERSFARNQPTITIDGCEKLCARRATALYSGKPLASFIVTEFVDYHGLKPPTHRRDLDEGEMALARALAESVAAEVDTLVQAQRSGRTDGVAAQECCKDEAVVTGGVVADARYRGAGSKTGDGLPACACQSSAPPARGLQLASGAVQVVGLDPILALFAREGRPVDIATMQDMLWMLKIYNAVPAESEGDYAAALQGEYQRFLAHQEKPA